MFPVNPENLHEEIKENQNHYLERLKLLTQYENTVFEIIDDIPTEQSGKNKLKEVLHYGFQKDRRELHQREVLDIATLKAMANGAQTIKNLARQLTELREITTQ